MVRSSGSPRPTPMSRRMRSEEHTSELQSPQISYAVFCLKKKIAVLLLMLRLIGIRFRLATPRCAHRSECADLATARLVQHPMVVLDVPLYFFFLKDPPPTEIYPLSLPDPLPI